MYKKNILGVGGVGDDMVIIGNCDVLVSGLSAGAVKLQALFPGDIAFIDVPGGSYVADTFTTIFISEDGVKMRLVGVANNAGVVARLGRFLNG